VRPAAMGCMWLFNGLSVANHLQGILTTPILAVVTILAWTRRQVSFKQVGLGVLLGLLGTLPYTVLVGRELLATGDLPGTLESALVGAGGRYRANVANLLPSVRCLVVGAGFTLLSFPNLLIPIALYGLSRRRWRDGERSARAVLGTALVLHAVFALRYDVVDQHTFFLPTYVLLSIFGGVGAAGLLAAPAGSGLRRWMTVATVFLAATPVLYAAAPAVARAFHVLEAVARHKPYRDDYVYLFSPWGMADTSAERMSSQAVRLAGEGGLILVEDPMAIFALRYKVIEAGYRNLEVWPLPAPRGDGTGLKRRQVLAEAQRALAAGRTVVLVPLDTRKAAPTALPFRRQGDLFVASAPPARSPSQPSGGPAGWKLPGKTVWCAGMAEMAETILVIGPSPRPR